MAIDAATRESLELTRTAGGQRAGSLLDAVDRTVTGAGARALAGDLSAPLMERAAIEARLDLVGLLRDDAGLRDALRASLRASPDIGRALGRLAAGGAARAIWDSCATGSTRRGGWGTGYSPSPFVLKVCWPAWRRACSAMAR